LWTFGWLGRYDRWQNPTWSFSARSKQLIQLTVDLTADGLTGGAREYLS